MMTLIAAIRSLATYVGISLYVLFAAPPGLLLAFAFGWSDILYILGHGGVRLGLFLSGIRCSVTRSRARAARDVPSSSARIIRATLTRRSSSPISIGGCTCSSRRSC